MNITSKIVALSSAVAFALQIALALLMLRYFSPEEVGMFSVISQIGFFWTTLALAQTPLQILANHGTSVIADTRQAWLSSLQRFVWLSPAAVFCVWCSSSPFVKVLLWALLLSLCQLTWMLAQNMRLRMASRLLLMGVRVLPPLASLVFASIAVLFSWKDSVLLQAVVFGYFIGAFWILPTIIKHPITTANNLIRPTNVNCSSIENFSRSFSNHISSDLNSFQSNASDNRSTSLRIAHAFVDALFATAIVLIWQRLYGIEETGWVSAPLRVMGFFPALVHVAWAQVMMASNYQRPRIRSLKVGLLGVLSIAVLSTFCLIGLRMGWLSSDWQGTLPYLIPLALWQGCACISATFSHKAFQFSAASKYSWLCMLISATQGCALLVPFIFASTSISATTHIWLLSAVSGVGLLIIAYWLANLSRSPKVIRKSP